jgi:6-methylsalicylate decarboxylase
MLAQPQSPVEIEFRGRVMSLPSDEWSRRAFVSAGLLAGGSLVGATGNTYAASTQKTPPANGAGRIDVHQHFLPQEFLAALARHGMSAWAPATWSADGALAMMDENEIAVGILSLSTPGPHLGDDLEGRTLAQQVNERLAELVKSRPDRFGMFASVPLPDVDGALGAIRYAYDDLAADGVILLASTRGVYLGEPDWEPVMAELNRRSAVVFVHPGPLAGPPVPGVHPAVEDFLLDTTRAATNLVLKGVPRRYPKLRFILSHAGGFLPYAAYRIAAIAGVVDPTIDSNNLLADLSNFYFDTALSGSPTVMPSLLTFARPGHVLFGSDWPYAPRKTVQYFTDNLDKYQGLDTDGHAAINRTNAEALFSRLAKQQHAYKSK